MTVRLRPELDGALKRASGNSFRAVIGSRFRAFVSWRVGLTVSVAVVAALMAGFAHANGPNSDFIAFLAAGRAWLQGLDPYLATGPGRSYEWDFPLVYPFMAILVGLPFTVVPWPDAWFMAFGVGLWAWGITADPRHRMSLWMVPTIAFFQVVRLSQWSTLLTGAALLPTWGFLLTCKPTIGAALWLAYPTRRALLGGLAFTLVSLALLPPWPWSWLDTLNQAPHMRPPLFFHGGPILLLALLRWRRPDGRLLAAMACMPQAQMYYDAVPLFLIPRRMSEGLTLALGMWVVALATANPPRPDLDPMAYWLAERVQTGQWMVWALYLPALVMVLRRPNQADVDDFPQRRKKRTPDAQRALD